MNKHTPGPWTRKKGERFKNDNIAGVRGPDGLYVVAAFDFNQHNRDSEVEANAKLIAAAPELLEVAQEALMNCSIDNHGGGDDLDCKFCNHARAVIAKATT